MAKMPANGMRNGKDLSLLISLLALSSKQQMNGAANGVAHLGTQ